MPLIPTSHSLAELKIGSTWIFLNRFARLDRELLGLGRGSP